MLPVQELRGREPEGDLLLGALDRVGAVADVAADVDGVVTTDGARGGGQGVGGTQDGTAGLDDVLALPDHGADGTAQHVWRQISGESPLMNTVILILTGDEALEERLASEVGVVLLEVLLAGSAELHGNELEAAVLEARDDGANEATLGGSVSETHSIDDLTVHSSQSRPRDSHIRTWTPSGLMAMKLRQSVSFTASTGGVTREANGVERM